MRIGVILFLWTVAAFADVCAPTDVQSTYGFQMSGISTIPGKPTPIAAIGRMVFDADGKVAGYSSVNFNGLFLGNPVTGTYEIKTDCTMTWKLQDPSGGWQNFAGKARPGGSQVEYHQVDPGAGPVGLMQKLSAMCTDSALTGTYAMALNTTSTPLARDRTGDGESAARVQADGNGGLTLIWARGQTFGTYSVDDECFVELEFAPPDGDPMKLRGVLADSGNQVMAVHTDPQVVGTARLRR